MPSAELLPAAVLKRKAVVYIRLSTQAQVQTNLESQRRQYELVDVARQRASTTSPMSGAVFDPAQRTAPGPQPPTITRPVSNPWKEERPGAAPFFPSFLRPRSHASSLACGTISAAWRPNTRIYGTSASSNRAGGCRRPAPYRDRSDWSRPYSRHPRRGNVGAER
jgi:hypothetical protein